MYVQFNRRQNHVEEYFVMSFCEELKKELRLLSLEDLQELLEIALKQTTSVE